MKLCPHCQSLCSSEVTVCPQCGGALSASEVTDADRLVGMTLGGKYELVEYLGEGAMGWVYRGVHQVLNNSVAVKILKPEFRPDPSRAERFRMEAQAASRLNHPHIISVIDFGETPTGLPYIVSEYLRGVPLSTLISREAPFSLKRAYRIMSQILSALEESHNAGVIHRDLKPDNIMVSKLRDGEEFVKILDFGIAKLADAAPGTRLTQAGQIFGTPDYMAPEQIRSQEVTPATDLYAAGIILFEMLTGRLPFVQETLFDILKDHLYTKPPTLAEANPKGQYDEALEAIVQKALAKDPKDRFQSAKEFHRVLRRAFRLATGKVRKCPACGAYVRRGVRFCPECGYQVTTSEKTTTPSVHTKATATATESHFGLRRLWAGDKVELPFVGRKAELAAIEELVGGAFHTLVLVGEAGSGKSTLGYKAMRAAMRAGLPVLTIRPHPSLLPVSWYPIAQAVRRILGLPATPAFQDFEAALEKRPEFQDDAAGLAMLLGLPGPLSNAEPETQKRELEAAAARVLSLGWDGLVFFDDVDQYDMASLQLLTRLVSRQPRRSKLLIATSVPILAESPGVAVRHLNLLSEEECRELVELLVRNNRKGSWTNLLADVTRRTGGNPLWLEQLLLFLTESGTETTQGLTDIIATRASRLPTPALELLQALAVLGTEASIEDVRYLLGNRPLADATLDLVAHRGYIAASQAESTSATLSHRLRFRHPLYAQVLRESLPRDVRRQLNERAADLAARLEWPWLVRAHHLLEAERHEEAVEALERAGRQAVGSGDPAGAAMVFRRAAETARWELLVADEDELNIRLNMALAESLNAAGDRKGSLAVLKYLEGLLRVRPKERIRARYAVARHEAALSKPAKAIQSARSAVGEALLLGDLELIAQGYALLADLLLGVGDKRGAIDELEEAISVLLPTENSPFPRGVPSIWNLVARYALLRASDNPNRAIAIVRQAVEAARETSRPAARAKCLLALAHCEYVQGNLELARRTLEEALDTYRTLGDRQGQAVTLFHKARLETNGKSEQYRTEATHLMAELGQDQEHIQALVRSTNTIEFVAAEATLMA